MARRRGARGRSGAGDGRAAAASYGRAAGSVQLADPHQIRQQLHLAEASAGGFRLLEFAH